MCSECGDIDGCVVGVRIRLSWIQIGHQLPELDTVQGRCKFVEYLTEIRREADQDPDLAQHRRAVAGRKCGQQRADAGAIDAAQHAAYAGFVEGTGGVGDRLIQQRQPIAQAAVGAAREQADCAIVDRQLFGSEDVPHLPGDLLHFQPFEIELQAARQHRDRQLLRIGGGEQELYVIRRFFQGLQQRIEGRLRQHVHFVDQIHLGAAARRHVLRVLDHLAHIVHAGVAGGVDLEQIDETAGIDIHARCAFAAGLGALPAFAVQAFREDPRDGGLADPARATEQQCVVHATAVERIGQGAHHVLLPHQFGETPGTPFAGQNEIGHARIVPTRSGRAKQRSGARCHSTVECEQ